MSEIKSWKTLDSKIILETPQFKIRHDTCLLPGGTIVPDYVVREAPNVAAVFAVTKGEEVVFVRQYRQALGAVTLELPAGRQARHDLTIEDTARRELAEETGYSGETFTAVGTWGVSPHSTARLSLFYVPAAEKVTSPRSSGGEVTEVVLVAVSNLKGLIERGELSLIAHVGMVYRMLDRFSA